MAMRLSGLMSGMDTESIVEQLVMAKRTKVDNAKKAQTKLQWTQDAWKTLNAKIKKFYDGALSNMRFEGSFLKKTTKVSNSSVVSVITGANAMNTVQSLKVKQMAQSAYLTGGQVGRGDQKGKMGLTSDDRLTKLGYDFDDQGKIMVTVGGETTVINITGAATIGELVQSFKDAGLEASFDATNQRFYIASKGTGTENDFTITAANINGLSMLHDLGLYYVSDSTKKQLESTAGMTEADVDKAVASRLQNRLREVTNRKADLLNSQRYQYEELEELAKKYEEEFADCYDGDVLDPDKARAKVKELLAEDENDARGDGILKYSEFISWDQAMTQTEESLSEVNSKLTTDDEGNVVFTEEEKAKVEADLRKEINDEIIDAKGQLQLITGSGAVKNNATDAVIELNGVEYTGSRNTFEINGLTLTVNATTADNETVTLTTQDDTDGIYDMIKNFIKEYNGLINEMDKLYNADSSRGYEPLTDDEKDAMSDREIEEWEAKIKDSLLRRDDTLGTISNALKQMMLSGVTVNGKQMYLSTFGIETLGYFTAADNEKNAYHIDGDPDDANTSGNEDKLKAMIASDPQSVIDFFVGLSRNMYSDLTDRMAKTDFSSSYTIYEDVRMKQEYDSYTQKIKELEAKLADYEDKWYSKFAKMETAMAKLQSNVSAVTALLGG